MVSVSGIQLTKSFIVFGARPRVMVIVIISWKWQVFEKKWPKKINTDNHWLMSFECTCALHTLVRAHSSGAGVERELIVQQSQSVRLCMYVGMYVCCHASGM